jgi:hypothetical protein
MKISEQHYISTIQSYDRVVILADRIIEHILHGNGNPPKELMDQYFDAVDNAGQCLNVDRLHEQVVRANSEFFEEIEEKFSLEDRVDNPPIV